MTGNTIELCTPGLTLHELERIAEGAPITLSQAVWQRVQESHQRLLRYLDEDRQIYGVTTGYGPLADTQVGRNYSGELQRNLIAHLSAGVGEPLSRVQTRATMAARLAALARGHSGVSPDAIMLLLQCLNHDAIPVVPAMGTVGASGDLTPLAHIAGALMGQGRMCHRGDTAEPAREVLSRLSLTPFDPGGKDALALVNGTSAMTGIAGVNGSAAGRMLKWSTLLSACHAQVLEGRREAWDPAFGAVRPHPGQQRIHRWLDRLFAGPVAAPATDSEHVAPSTIRPMDGPIQDPYSLRCVPQLLGATMDQISWHDQTVHIELNSVTDNPILHPDEDRMLHGGNFYGQHVALASDALANAIITMAVHAERRIARLCNPRLNQGLPAFLQPRDTGLHSGFMGAQVTASALLAEMRTYATPASIQSIPTNGDNQDVVTMGTIGARRCAHLLSLLQRLLSIDSLILAQAQDLTGDASDPEDGSGLSHLYQWVRQFSARLDADRPLSEDIETLAGAMGRPDTLVDRLEALQPD